ncbi:Rrf2 family transcriptional regulator [Bacillus sp. JJ722]|uniref:Rrf2 family transcriptional regulator n=1 Tax=Bacillus sp. JJ722 TaxID=3122973 RepID=UPI002FFEB27E
MRLTSYTDYSIRVLLYLHIHDNQLSTIQDIANAYGISKNHLMKIIYNLGKLGYIETIRGRNGGIRLAKSPSEINIGKLVRETEEDFNIVECFSKDHDTCPITSLCTLKGVLNQAMYAFLKVLDGYTLDDISKNKIKLRELFDS